MPATMSPGEALESSKLCSEKHSDTNTVIERKIQRYSGLRLQQGHDTAASREFTQTSKKNGKANVIFFSEFLYTFILKCNKMNEENKYLKVLGATYRDH